MPNFPAYEVVSTKYIEKHHIRLIDCVAIAALRDGETWEAIQAASAFNSKTVRDDESILAFKWDYVRSSSQDFNSSRSMIYSIINDPSVIAVVVKRA